MSGEWIRDDLPSPKSVERSAEDNYVWITSYDAEFVLGVVVDHLNANHPKSGTDRWRRAHEIVERERDLAREQWKKWEHKANEADREVSTWRTSTESAHSDFLQAAHDRDEWQNRAEVAEGAVDSLERDRDEWRSRAEAAETRTATAVTKAEIEKAIRGKTWAANREPNMAGFHRVHIAWATDSVWSLVSGADPAVFVVRESGLPHMEDDYIRNFDLSDGRGKYRNATDEEIQEAREMAESDLRWLIAVQRHIEAEQSAPDPVEELAEQIESAARTAIRQVCDDLATVAPSLDPLAVERAMELTAASRKVAAHFLEQEAGDGR